MSTSPPLTPQRRKSLTHHDPAPDDAFEEMESFLSELGEESKPLIGESAAPSADNIGALDLDEHSMWLDNLEEEHRSTLLAMFKGGKKLKDPVRTPSVAASERSRKRKKSQTSKRKPTTKKEKMDEDGDSEEVMSDDGDEKARTS